MKERPILFNAEMVNAILSGRKTQTRRAVKKPEQWQLEEQEPGLVTFEDKYGDHHNVLNMCPFGQVGDRLWVRENFKVPKISQGGKSNEAQCYGEDDYFVAVVEYVDGKQKVCEDLYVDECEKVDQPAQALRFSKKNGFSPNIHMPRWACRLVLEVTDVRVERLQDISGEDVFAEGVDNGASNPAMGERWENMQRMAFQNLWNTIYNNWESNPWVWVVEFKVVEI